jgi:hypothetical protein
MSDLTDRLREHAGSPVHHWEDWANRSDSLLTEAASHIERLEEALKEISSPTQSTNLLWWQVRAREALNP